MLKKIIILCLVIISTNGYATLLAEKTTTSQDQIDMAVTIYNNNLALIKDTRNIRLDSNLNKLAWREVSAKIQSETALLRNITSPTGFHLQEQNFDFDLLTPQKLLEKYTNRKISVIRTHPGSDQETKEKAIVLATNGGIVLKFDDRIETGIPGRLAFPDVPNNLRDKPTLVTTFQNAMTGNQKLELSYLTTGLSWQADYVAELNAADSHIDLNGLVTLTNQSGTTFPEAKLQLVAGDVNRVHQPEAGVRRNLAMSAEMANAPAMIEEALFEYHLYTLQHPTTLAENQTKQVALMSTTNIPIEKEFLLQGSAHYFTEPHGILSKPSKIGVFIEFQNKGEGLGIPLPKGIIRVYKKDKQGNAQFIGENQIDHTPKNKHIRLKLGNAFDLTANKKQTDYKKLHGKTKNTKVFETAHKITLKNTKDTAVTITVVEPIPGDWKILAQSHPHQKTSSNTAEWTISIPGKHKISLTYRVRTKYTY